MKTLNLNIQVAQNCWIYAKDLNKEGKLWLLNKISESLLISEKKEKMQMKGKDKTAEFLKKFAGRWESKLSAEEIINNSTFASLVT